MVNVLMDPGLQILHLCMSLASGSFYQKCLGARLGGRHVPDKRGRFPRGAALPGLQRGLRAGSMPVVRRQPAFRLLHLRGVWAPDSGGRGMSPTPRLSGLRRALGGEPRACRNGLSHLS